MIITISREYGSGGRRIAQELAKLLNIPYYDREIISETTRESGYSEQILESLEKRPANKLLYSMIMGTSRNLDGQTLDEQLFEAESNVIKGFAAKSDAVIVGRCADFVLEGQPDKFDFFIFGSDEYRIKNLEGDDYEKSDSMSPTAIIRRMDRRRAAYYQFFTGRTWGRGGHYDLCISPERLGVHGTALLLSQYIQNAHEAEKK